MERREFFKSLIAGGAAVSERPAGRNRRAHHADTVVYHGPMLIPEDVLRIISAYPGLKRTTHRHLVSRYASAGWTWIFRCAIPAHRKMLGDIRRTPSGQIRVACWSAVDPQCYYRDEEPAAILERKMAANIF